MGDEKVVAEQVPPVVGYLADTWPAYRFTADSHPPATYPVVRLSDYASLLEEKNQVAADRDLWRSMATFEGKVSASVLDDLHTTQAQLAELRGRVSLYGQERAHLQDVNAHLIKVLSAIHMRCAPKDIEMADGTKRRFVPPDPEFYWRELSGKVAAIKAEIQFTPRTLAAADGGGG